MTSMLIFLRGITLKSLLQSGETWTESPAGSASLAPRRINMYVCGCADVIGRQRTSVCARCLGGVMNLVAALQVSAMP